MAEIFLVNIRDFKKGERLHAVLRQCALALITHNPEVEMACGGTTNKSTTALRKAFRKAKVTDETVGLSPVNVLGDWSKIIQWNYTTRVLQDKTRGEGGKKLLGAIFKLAADTLKDFQEIKANQGAILLKNASLKASNSQLQNQTSVLKGEVVLLNTKLSKFTTPPPRSRMKSRDELDHPWHFRHSYDAGPFNGADLLDALEAEGEQGSFAAAPTCPVDALVPASVVVDKEVDTALPEALSLDVTGPGERLAQLDSIMQ